MKYTKSTNRIEKKSKTESLQKTKNLAKKIAFGFLGVFVILCIFAQLGEEFGWAKLNVRNLSGDYANIPNSVRRELQKELEKTILLNRGYNAKTNSSFVFREDGENEASLDDKSKYVSFYIDNDELQLSFRAQASWGSGYGRNKESFSALIECAGSGKYKYDERHCIDLNLSRSEYYLKKENFALLETYGASKKTIMALREQLGLYLKTTHGDLFKSVLVENIRNRDGILFVDLVSENGDKLALEIHNYEQESETLISLKKDSSEIWNYKVAQYVEPIRHYSTISNKLPVDLRTNNGTDFRLRWSGNNKLRINSDICKNGDTKKEIIESAEAWLEEQNYNSKDFEITTINTCSEL